MWALILLKQETVKSENTGLGEVLRLPVADLFLLPAVLQVSGQSRHFLPTPAQGDGRLSWNGIPFPDLKGMRTPA